MTVRVFSAQYRYRGPDRLDITRVGVDKALRAGQPAPGAPFAPSSTLLWPHKVMLEQVEVLSKVGQHDAAESLARAAWESYRITYDAEMRVSAGQRRDRWGALEHLAYTSGVRPSATAWRALLARSRVVLVCFCTNAEMCHRSLLARALAACGAMFAGEIDLANLPAEFLPVQPEEPSPETTGDEGAT